MEDWKKQMTQLSVVESTVFQLLAKDVQSEFNASE